VIYPYKTAEPRHTTGLKCRLDEYVEMIFNVKSWTVAVDVTIHHEDGGSARLTMNGVLDEQFFTGPWNIADAATAVGEHGLSYFNSKWLPNRMTAGTRFVVHDSRNPDDGSKPLEMVDIEPYIGPGSEVEGQFIGAWMLWRGSLDWTTKYTYPTPEGGEAPPPFEQSGTRKDAFYLPLMGAPLSWWDTTDPGAVPEQADYYKFTSFADNLIYLAGEYYCGAGLKLMNVLGNTLHLYPAATTATGATMKINNLPVTGGGSMLLDDIYGGPITSSLTGTAILTPAALW